MAHFIKLTLKSNDPLQCILRLDLFRCKTWFNDNRGYRHNRWNKLPTLFTFRYLQENGALQLKHTLNHLSMESILKSCISLLSSLGENHKCRVSIYYTIAVYYIQTKYKLRIWGEIFIFFKSDVFYDHKLGTTRYKKNLTCLSRFFKHIQQSYTDA